MAAAEARQGPSVTRLRSRSRRKSGSHHVLDSFHSVTFLLILKCVGPWWPHLCFTWSRQVPSGQSSVLRAAVRRTSAQTRGPGGSRLPEHLTLPRPARSLKVLQSLALSPCVHL